MKRLLLALALLAMPLNAMADCPAGGLSVGNQTPITVTFQNLDGTGESTALGANAKIEIAYHNGTLLQWWNAGWSGTRVSLPMTQVASTGQYYYLWTPDATVSEKDVLVRFLDSQATDTAIGVSCTTHIHGVSRDGIAGSVWASLKSASTAASSIGAKLWSTR